MCCVVGSNFFKEHWSINEQVSLNDYDLMVQSSNMAHYVHQNYYYLNSKMGISNL